MRSVLFVAVVFGFVAVIVGRGQVVPADVSATSCAQKLLTLPDYYKKYTLSFGNPNAPIKIHKFFSFVCPSCVMFHKHHFPAIRKQFIDTGKVYWTFVPYAMDVDTIQVMTAAAICQDIMKFKVFELVMENAIKWSEENNKDKIIQILKSCGASDKIVEDSLKKDNYETVLRESCDFQEYILIDGTPTLFVNGVEIPGIPNSKKLSKIIIGMLNLEEKLN